MGEVQSGADSDIDLHIGRNDKQDDMQVDTAMAVAARAFGAPLSLKIPFWKAAAIEAQASQVQNLDADKIIGNGGPIGQKSREQLKAERDEENSDRFRDVIALISEEQERQREHEAQWLATSHTYAGQTMDGAQWKALATWFRDADNISDWEDAMMAKTGQTREEVRVTGGKMKRFYDLMDKDAKGTLKPDERGEFTSLQEDPNLKRGIEIQRQVQGLRADRGHDQTASSDQSWDGGQVASLSVSDQFADDKPAKGLEAVKPVSPTYNVAASGIESAPAAPAPTKPIAANTVQVSPDNMFG